MEIKLMTNIYPIYEPPDSIKSVLDCYSRYGLPESVPDDTVCLGSHTVDEEACKRCILYSKK